MNSRGRATLSKDVIETQNPHNEGDDVNDQDEFDSEIIPRSIPTPMEKISTSSSILDTSSNDNSHSTQIDHVSQNMTTNKEHTSNIHNHVHTYQMNQHHNQMIGNQNYITPSVSVFDQKTPSCTKVSMSSIKTKLFNNTLQLSSTELVERTSSLLHCLSSLGFIPKDGTVDRTTRLSKNDEKCNGKEFHEHFLLLLYRMIENVCEEETNATRVDGGDNNKKDTIDNNEVTLQLHALLSVMENVVDALVKANQDVDLSKHQYHNQTIMNDSKHDKQKQSSSTSTHSNSFSVVADDENRTTSMNQSYESNIQSSQAISMLQQENDMLRRQLMEIDETQLMSLQTQLTVKQLDCERLQEIIHSLEQERNHLHHLCQDNQSTNSSLEREIRTFHTEYEACANENNILQMDLMKKSQCINDYERRIKVTEDNVHALNAARNEILSKWNEALKERTRLEGELGQSSRDNAILQQQLQYALEEKYRYSKHIESLENEEQNRIAELASSHHERKKIAMELDIIKQKLSNVQEENQCLTHDLNARMMNSDLVSQKMIELEQIAAKSQYDTDTFRNMVSEMEMERDVIKNDLEEARIKIKTLENMKTSFETRESTASEQIRKLIREKALLSSKLNEATARNAKLGFVEKEKSSFSVTHTAASKMSSEHEENVVTTSETSICDESKVSEVLSNLQLTKSSVDSSIQHREKPQNIEYNVVGEGKRSQCSMNHGPACFDVTVKTEEENEEPHENHSESSLRAAMTREKHHKEKSNDVAQVSLSLLDYLPHDTASTID